MDENGHAEDALSIEKNLQYWMGHRFSNHSEVDCKNCFALLDATHFREGQLSDTAWKIYARLFFLHHREFENAKKLFPFLGPIEHVDVYINGKMIVQLPRNHLLMVSNLFRKTIFAGAQGTAFIINVAAEGEPYVIEAFQYIKTGRVSINKDNVQGLLQFSYKTNFEILMDTCLNLFYRYHFKGVGSLSLKVPFITAGLKRGQKEFVWCCLRIINQGGKTQMMSNSLLVNGLIEYVRTPHYSLHQSFGSIQVNLLQKKCGLNLLGDIFPLTLNFKFCSLLMLKQLVKICPQVENILLSECSPYFLKGVFKALEKFPRLKGYGNLDPFLKSIEEVENYLKGFSQLHLIGLNLQGVHQRVGVEYLEHIAPHLQHCQILKLGRELRHSNEALMACLPFTIRIEYA